MNGKKWFACCAVVVVMSLGLWVLRTLAQSADNPFGSPTPAPTQADGNPFGNPTTDAAQTDNDAFKRSIAQRVQQQPSERRPTARPQGPFELLGEQAPPQAQPQPVAGAAPAAGSGCQCVGEAGDVTARLKKALLEPLHDRGIEYDGPALEEVVSELSTEYGIPIKLDLKALDAAGQGPADPVKVHLRGISLRSALNQMLRQLSLTYIIQDEVILITTPAESEKHLHICLYDVRDLVAGPGRATDLDTLLDIIQSEVQSDSWVDNGGTGDIRAMQAGIVVVSQTQAVHEEIGNFLTSVRQMMARAPVGAGADWRPPADRVVTKNYALAIAKPDNQEVFQNQLRGLIVSLMPNETWVGTLPDGQPVLLSVLPDRVVVRHRPAVQRQVEALLADLGITTSPQAEAGHSGAAAGMGGGGFGGRGRGGFGGGGGIFQPQKAGD